jgi:hypothetical protein
MEALSADARNAAGATEAKARAFFARQGEAVSPLLGTISKLCSLAVAEHVSLDDDLLFEFYESVVNLPAKQQRKWRRKISDARGTSRNTFYDTDGLIKMRNRRGEAVPLVPLTISLEINERQRDAVDLAEGRVPQYMRNVR